MDVAQQITVLTERLNALETLYKQVNNFTVNHFILFWAIIVGVLAIIGVALYFVAKSIAESGVERNIKETNEKIFKLETSLMDKAEKISALSIRLQESRFSVPQEYDLPLSTGFFALPDHKCCFSKSQNGLVLAQLAAGCDSHDFPRGVVHVACLPYGFRPSKQIEVSYAASSRIIIEADGLVTLLNNDIQLELLVYAIAFYAQ